MSTDKLHADAVRALAAALVERGVLPDAAQQLAERHGQTRFLFDRKDQARVLARDHTLYPVSRDDPNGLEALADEVAARVPSSDRGGPSREEVLERIKQRQRASGLYAF
jgi:hypothetical protein